MVPKKRDLATLQRLIEHFGDVRLSEAMAGISAVRPRGRPRKWDDFLLELVFCGVETLQEKKGLSYSAACESYAKFWGGSATVSQIDKAYQKAIKENAKFFTDLRTELLDRNLKDFPRFREFVETGKLPQYDEHHRSVRQK